MKLSVRQRCVLKRIYEHGVFWVDNCQNATVKKLNSLGLTEFNNGYNGLILTKKGQELCYQNNLKLS